MDVWNLEDLLGNRKPEDIIIEIKNDVEKFKSYRPKLDIINTPEFKEIILLKEKISVNFSNISIYYELKSSENTSASVPLAKLKSLEQLGSDVDNEMLFFSLWFKFLDDTKADIFINAPELSDYKHYMKRVRAYKRYTLSEEVEKIINIKNITGGNSFSTVYDIITNAYTFKWGKKTLNKEELIKFYKDKDPEKRKKAYDLMLGKYGEESPQLTEIYKNITLEWYNEDVKIRGYKNPISSRNLTNDVDDETVEVLLQVIRDNVGIFQEYFRLKYEWNNKHHEEKYPYSRYHLYAPLKFKSKKYSYEKAKNIMLNTYKKFDKRFYDAAMTILEQKHVHSHPQEKKRGGAFCYFTNDMAPYIMLNHTDDMHSLSTMMHEFGHGIHDVFAQKQKPLLRHATIPIAETASTFGEMILTDLLLKKSKNSEEKKHLLATFLDDQYATVLRQGYFVLFEKFAHDAIKEGATKEELDSKYQELLKEQFGEMEIPDVFKHEWNYIPHIHNSPFYCYSYAFGNLLVLSLFDAYRKEGKPFVDKYVDFLSSGGSKSIPELVSGMGYDAKSKDFWQKGFNVIKDNLEELKKLQQE